MSDSRIAADDHRAVYDLIMAGWGSQTVRALASLSIAEHLDEGPLTVSEIAVRERCDLPSLTRLLRAAAAFGFVEYDDLRDIVRGTERLSILHARSTHSLKHYAQAAIGRAFWLPAVNLVDAVRDGRSQAERALGSDVMGWLAVHPDEARQMAAAMSELSAPIISAAIERIEVRDAIDVVDVGGAEGAFLVAALTRWPQLRGYVLDTPTVVAGAMKTIEHHDLAGRMSAVAGDFLTAVPPADLYLVKSVLHDWDDDTCRRILRTVRDNMRPRARILIVEMSCYDHAPSVTWSTMDIAMMFAGGGRERRVSEFSSLLRDCGLKLVEISALGPPYYLFEARAA